MKENLLFQISLKFKAYIFRIEIQLLQEGGLLPGLETGLFSNTQKWFVRGDPCADKARDFIGKGHPGGEQEGKGTQENCSAEFYGDGISFRVVFGQSS